MWYVLHHPPPEFLTQGIIAVLLWQPETEGFIHVFVALLPK